MLMKAWIRKRKDLVNLVAAHLLLVSFDVEEVWSETLAGVAKLEAELRPEVTLEPENELRLWTDPLALEELRPEMDDFEAGVANWDFNIWDATDRGLKANFLT